MSEDDFLALVTAGQPAAPDYFVYDAVLNRKAHDVFDPPATRGRWTCPRCCICSRPAPSWSTPATRRSSPQATWRAP